jgi:phage pi2 protein 07
MFWQKKEITPGERILTQVEDLVSILLKDKKYSDIPREELIGFIIKELLEQSIFKKLGNIRTREIVEDAIFFVQREQAEKVLKYGAYCVYTEEELEKLKFTKKEIKKFMDNNKKELDRLSKFSKKELEFMVPKEDIPMILAHRKKRGKK